jgi:hypothetical protein
METNQIMDNLVRAHNGLPILHIDYDAITGTVTDNVNGHLDSSYTDAAGAITRMIAATLGGSNEKQLGVTGNPVRNDPELYMAYLQFLKTSPLLESAEPPPLGAAHLVRCCNGHYFWVPIERRGEFFELSMRVIGLRKAPEPVPQYVEVMVKEAIVLSPKEIADDDIKTNQYVQMRLSLAESVKSDSGTFSVEIEGVSYQFVMAPRGRLPEQRRTGYPSARFGPGRRRLVTS